MESKVGLVVVGVLALLCAARGGYFALLVLDLACAAVIGHEWYVGEIAMDSGDIVLAAMGGLALLGQRTNQGLGLRDIPLLKSWLFVGVLFSLAYLTAPINADRLTDPLRIAYQLYRYCWKPILMYPITILIVGTNARRGRTLITCVLVAGCYGALSTVGAYLSGTHATDLISDKNRFAGSLIAPTIACLALVLATPSGAGRVLLFAGLTVLGVGLVAAGSRGAIVASVAAAAAVIVSLARFRGGRKRILQAMGWAAAGVLTILLIVPDISSLPGVRLLSELQHGSQVDNLRWRMQLRWPYFLNQVEQHPWLGVGTDRDTRLSDTANTPHNGYLSLAMIRGIPAALLVALFGMNAAIRARRVFLRKGDASIRILSMGVSAAIIGLLVHNLVESTLTTPYVQRLYWLLVALGATCPLFRNQPAGEPSSADREQRDMPRRHQYGRIPVRPLVSHEHAPGR